MSAHAVFAPSAAHRWFACPGSIRLSEQIVTVPSVYADEGTAAHTVAELCLTEGHDAEVFLGAMIDVRPGVAFPCDEEMAQAVQVFLDLVRGFVEDGYELRSEAKLDLGHLWPGQFGTGDAVLYHPQTKDLQIVDFKYGRHVVVEPDENPQLLSYLSGAAKLYHNAGVETVMVHIVQPRVPGPPVKSWPTTVERLAAFDIEFQQAAALASRADAPLIAGPHCQFCPAAGFCPALREKSLRIAQAEFADDVIALLPVETMTPAQLGKVMTEIGLIEAWCSAVRDYALASALEGHIPDGFKLVSKRTNRRWIDEEKASAALRSFYDLEDAALFVRKLISPAQAEKLVGKKEAIALKALTMHPPGGTTLAPLSDKRKAVSVNAADEFAEDTHVEIRAG